jgi:Protein of unknown function (DUF3293)
MPDDQSLLEAKWASYPCTILEFAPPERVRIDLRLPLGRPERAALASLGLDRPFAVLTAENPFGENPEDEPTANMEAETERRNAARRAALEAELRKAGAHFQPCDGVAADGDYREHGVAVLLPRDQAVMLARRFGQLAIFWFDGRSFSLIGAVARKQPVKLPRS